MEITTNLFRNINPYPIQPINIQTVINVTNTLTMCIPSNHNRIISITSLHKNIMWSTTIRTIKQTKTISLPCKQKNRAKQNYKRGYNSCNYKQLPIHKLFDNNITELAS